MKFLTAQNFAKLLLLLFALCIALMLNSCVTYQKCVDKYASKLSKPDTVVYTQYEKLIVPHDSIVFSFVNDTNWINVLPTIKIGRARLSIKKTKDSTFVRADCDSVSQTITTRNYKIYKTSFGVSPNWKYAFYVLFAFFIVLLLYALINLHRKK